MSTWHDLNPDETIHALDTDLNGLTEQEVKNRRSIHGKNKLKEPEKTSSLLRFFSQYHDPLNYLLIAAAIVALLIHPEQPGDAMWFPLML